MTNRFQRMLAVAAIGLSISASAFAQTPGSTTGAAIDAREAEQQRRIQQGINSGALTPGEAARLERRESSIERQEQRMRARDGGELTRRDREVLNERLDRTSRAIYHDKHNARRAH